MFYYLNGTVALIDQNLAVIDCGGVGYKCFTSNYTLAQLQPGKAAKLFTHCNVREDAFDIFGTPDQLTLAVLTQDEKTLTMAQGVGKKMASRILLELKDKFGGAQLEASAGVPMAGVPIALGSKTAEASAALAALGYSQSEIGQALKGVDVEQLPVEEIVRQALRAMVMK